MGGLFKFLGSDSVVYVGSALAAVALAVKALTPSYTIAHKVADGYLSFAVAHGLASTAAKADKAP